MFLPKLIELMDSIMSQEIEKAKKLAEERKQRAENFYKTREKYHKIKGLIGVFLFLVLMVLWIFNLFQRFDFEEVYR